MPLLATSKLTVALLLAPGLTCRLAKLKARKEEQERLDREAEVQAAEERIRAEAEAKERSKAAAIAKQVDAEERVV